MNRSSFLFPRILFYFVNKYEYLSSLKRILLRYKESLAPVKNLDSSVSFNIINAWPIRSTICRIRHKDTCARPGRDIRVDIAINRTMRRD